MQTVALPWIDESEYSALKSLILDLPTTYKHWVDRQRAVAAFLQVRGGAPEVAITSSEFRMYMLAGSRSACEKELWVLATLAFNTGLGMTVSLGQELGSDP